MIRVDLVNMISVDTFCDSRPMDEMGKRLREARKKAGFSSAMAAAKKHNWPPSTYAAHENGQNGFPPETADVYGEAFKVSAGWLLTGEGEPARKNAVKVEGLVSAGGMISTSAEDVGHEGLYEIEVPFPLPEDAAAYQISGDSMFPRYDDGDVIIVRKRHIPIEDVLNFESMVTTEEGDRYLKRVVEGSRAGHYDLESHNAPVIRNVKINSVAEIHSVVRRGQWRKLDANGRKRLVQRKLRKS